MKTPEDIPPYLNLSLEDMDGEIWKDVIGYEGLYQVSNRGRIKSLAKGGSGNKTMEEHILKLQVHRCGSNYARLQVRMHKNGKGKTVSVHRLVASNFIPNPDNKPHVDHIDTNPFNNGVPNLRWVSVAENANNPLTLIHRSKAVNGFKGRPEFLRKQREHQPRAKRVAQYDLNDNIIAIHLSQSAAARAVNGDINGISRACKGLYSQAYGYKWKYIN